MQAASLTNAFECPVCYGRYNASKLLPKSLPCGHSCCLKCMNSIFVRNNSIACPICRKVTNVQPTSLPTNYIVLDALPSVSVQPRVIMCPKHNNKIIDIFCSNCRVCVCPSCFFKDHIGHAGMDIPDDALNEMKSACSVLSRLDDICGEIPLTVTQLNEVEVDLQRKEPDIAAAILESFNRIHAAVDARKQALISSLPSKRLAVTSHKHRLESFLSDAQTSTQSFRDLLQSSDVVQFLSSREPIDALLSRLDAETRSDGFSVKYNNHLSLTCDIAGIIRSINQLGTLNESNEILKPCQTELECRMTIVDILKQTRSVVNWNGPDDEGAVFNWSEELPLGEWNGIAHEYNERRIQVSGNGLIRVLLLNELGMCGTLPDSVKFLTTLIHLDVGSNELTHLPDSISDLTSLKYLYFKNNKLTQEGEDDAERRFGRDGLRINEE